ncbi:MAG: glycine cleavage system aminomethyltransferase GcvT [Candidatus Saganbacteria bacterium]|nr:glycine cleavage system aminomethyltransferase GcvT [Candidatus Saganbacteria bacterium]
MAAEILKRTPLYEEHLRLGAKLVPFAGWEMPVSYPAGILAEHQAVRRAAGLFDIGHMGLIKVEGDGALALVQKAATNDAARLSMNQCQYSLLCNERGGVIDDLLVYRLPMFYLIVANAVNAERVAARLKAFGDNSSVGFYDAYCALSLQGPQACQLAEKVLSAALAGLKKNHAIWWRDIIISRTGYTGEDGCELIVAKTEAAKLWQAFMKEGVQPCGLGARDTLRLEAGLPLYGHEYDESTTPLEAGYGWAVKFDKSEFAGRAALLAEKSQGRKKQLVGIELDGRAIPRQGARVFTVDGRPLGAVTSGTFSPTLRRPVALAYLTAPAAQVAVEIRGAKYSGKVVDKAFRQGVK